MVDIIKKLKGDAKDRQRKGGAVKVAQAKPKFEPAHRFFVSNNWKSLLERRPSIAPKAAAAKPAADDSFTLPNVVAVDCEMVAVNDNVSALARLSIVDHEEKVLVDRYVMPREKVVDYRTHVSGITAKLLNGPRVLPEVVAKKIAAEHLKGKIVVGHSLQSDFQALGLSHPPHLLRDTALFRPLRPPGKEQWTPSLQKLAAHWLHTSIQEGQHNSVEDAQIALRLYRLQSRVWEKQMRSVMKSDAKRAAAPAEGSGGDAAPEAKKVDSDDEGEPVPDKGSSSREQKAATEQPAAPSANPGKKRRKAEKKAADLQEAEKQRKKRKKKGKKHAKTW